MNESQNGRHRIPVVDHPPLYQLSHHGDVFLDIDEDTVMMVGPGYGEQIRRTESPLSKLADKPELAAVVRRYWADRYGIRAGDCPPEPITVVRTRKSYRLTIDGFTLTISVVPPLDGGPIGDILESLQIDVSHGSRSMTFLTERFLDESED